MNRILRDLFIPSVVILALTIANNCPAHKKRVSQTDNIGSAADRGPKPKTTQGRLSILIPALSPE